MMTPAYLYPLRRMVEVVAALFAGGYGINVLYLLPGGNPLLWAGCTTEDALRLAVAMVGSAFIHAIGIRINGRWRWSPAMRFTGMTGHAAMFLMISVAAHGQAPNTGGFVYVAITVLMAAGAYSALRDQINALKGEAGYAGN